MKNLFTITPQTPFLETLARELWTQCEGDGFRLSRYLILLPTRRACRHLASAFTTLTNGAPVLLPRMRPLGDVDEDEMAFAEEATFDIPPAIAPLKRLMLLTQQVQRRDPSLSWDQAAQAAEALTKFLDQIQIEQCDISQLPNLIEEEELAEHWQQTLQFLDIVTRNWPLILAEQGCIDAAERRNLVLTAQAEIWKAAPPSFPIIAAGSTGSVPATAVLLNVIASLPNGSVILPGLDRALDNEAWDAIESTHPQNSMKNLLGKMGVDRHMVKDFGPPPLPSLRGRLLSEAMRPASVTDAWRELRDQLERGALDGLTRLTLDHPQEEAQVIALRLRQLLETPHKTAAFVTADRALAVRVASLLRRWGIVVDDSGGTPLAMLPIGSFLNLVLDAASPHAGAVDFLALLKHPLSACGQSLTASRNATREVEIRVRLLEDENFDALRALLEPLTRAMQISQPLISHINAHITVCEAIAATDIQPGASRLWLGESGEDTAIWFDEWREAADGFPNTNGSDYAALFNSLALTKTLRSARATHPRLNILGPLEARLMNADLVILGGLNEGSWPPDPGFDPWMSRPMRKKFNLPAPEFRIGLSAHDFVQLTSLPQVMLTRSLRSNGTPTVPSRFLLQIEAVLRAAGLSHDMQDALSPIEPWREWAHALDQPEEIKPCARPQPRPPIKTRPTTLSVTEITTWLRNPYAIYARHILKLKKLEELDAELDASDRGTMIHEALEKFIHAYPEELPEDAENQLLAVGQEVFARDQNNPRVQAFWWARFVEIATWFIPHERVRRAQGVKLLAAEALGSVLIAGLTLRGCADRIDRLPDGALSIVDYKTGSTPSKKEVEAGIEPQLQLLALIAKQGGFSVGAMPSEALEYWILKGGTSGCETRLFTKNIEELIANAEMGIENLMGLFADPATPYEAAPKPRLQPRYNDYAHLARLAEWGRTAEEI